MAPIHPRQEIPQAGDEEVELYQRTYTTLLRSSGETRLRILEQAHRAIQSSLHPFADSEDLDLGAFLYATQRLPEFSPSTATLFQALPYVLTLIAVAGVIGRSRPPASLGIPYVRA